MMNIRWNIAQIRADLIGGLVATILLLPESMAYGAIVFGPLGAAYVPLGIAAGLIGVVFSNLGGATAGGLPIMLTKPQSLAAIMLASILGTILVELETSPADPAAVAIALSLLFLVVMVSGITQILLGLFKIGNLVESIPYPVIAGLRNGTYITIVLAQLAPLLGLTRFSLLELTDHFREIQPYTTCVGLVTMVAILAAQRRLRWIPAPLVGIVVGTLFYHLLVGVGLGNQLGPLIGKIPSFIPTPRHLLTVWQQLGSPQYLQVVTTILPLSIGITAIITIKSVEASLIADSVMQERSNFNRELIGQGIGNLLAGIFGGIHNAGNSFAPATIYQLGARTPLVRFSCALGMLGILLFIGPVIALIPLAVLAGTLIVVTAGLVSRWSLAQARAIITAGKLTDKGTIDMLLVIFVAGVLVVIGIYEAVLFGILVSIAYFIYRMAQTAMRATYSGATVRSNTQRMSDDIAWLAAHGQAIQVIELQGSIFFATASRLARASRQLLLDEIDTLILDLAHVSDIDSTGLAMLEELRDKFTADGRQLYLSGIAPGSEVSHLLESFGLLNRFAEAAIFRDLNSALEQAETRLLSKAFDDGYTHKEVSLSTVRGLQQWAAADLAILQTFLTRRTFAKGATVVQEGDTDQRLFYIVQGGADLLVWSEHAQQATRIGSFRAGTTFGEMAILDGGPRSATIIAAEPLVCYELSAESLARLKAAYPEIAYQLMIGLGVELASRTRNRALWM